MEIHRFEKVWIAASIVLIVAWIATVTYGAVGAGVTMVDESGGTIDPGEFDGTGFAEPGVRAAGDGGVEVYVIAQQFLFDPGTTEPIRLPANTAVTFYVTSRDVIHGFEVVGTNVNVMVIPGQISEFTVRFDSPGTYGVVCNEYCGAAHHQMEGRIEVVPADEFEGAAA